MISGDTHTRTGLLEDQWLWQAGLWELNTGSHAVLGLPLGVRK